MTSTVQDAPSTPASPTARRPSPPRPALRAYLLIALLGAAVAIFLGWTADSSTIIFVPLGGSAYLWAPLASVIGVVVIAAVVLFCLRLRASATAATGAVAFVLFSWWAARTIDFTLAPLWEDLSRIGPVVEGFFNPNWSFIWSVRSQWLDTIMMAVTATVIGCFIGLLLAMLASPVSSPNKITSQVIKAINSVIRSIPDVGYALLFMVFIGGTAGGLGTLAGILALTMFNIGIIAKLTSETVDSVNKGPIEAADASGARLWQRNRVAVLPQALPGFISYSLYVFELNIRASAAIGIVGVAGIGQTISTQLNRIAWGGYENISAILIALVAVVLVVDMLSLTIRRRLM